MSALHRTEAEAREWAARDTMLDHAAGCPDCRERRAQSDPDGVCKEGARLIQAHRAVARQARQEDTR
ncbi:hypothetical protein [Streptomyces bottropensis]|uniref:hypothetical protein n=1 Tax=Streptomyces bottropensis TaxID=42235 RepID=UPI0036BCFE8F